jgi:hypothetical protein
MRGVDEGAAVRVEKESGIGEHRSYPRGRIALAAYTGGVGRCTVDYANVVVTELE